MATIQMFAKSRFLAMLGMTGSGWVVVGIIWAPRML